MHYKFTIDIDIIHYRSCIIPVSTVIDSMAVIRFDSVNAYSRVAGKLERVRGYNNTWNDSNVILSTTVTAAMLEV